jgi:hypothetical protein
MRRMHARRIGSLVAVAAVVGTVVSPVIASAASQSANTTINATVASVISITTSSTVAISLTPTSGGVVSSNSDTVTVNTNNTAGYALTLIDNDTNTNLVSGGNNIAASSNTTGAGNPATLANNTWGFAVAGNAGFDASYSAETNAASSTSKWAGITASSGTAYQIKSTSAVATNDTTTVWYAVKATSSQPNGTYSDTVTYTATTN